MKNFYTADCHFDHNNVIKLSERPFSSREEMEEKLIDNWNSVVTQRDHVYHLGDFAFHVNTFIRLIPKLNGFIHFIKGNHDKRPLRKLQNKLIENPKIVRNIKIYEDSIVNFTDGTQKLVLCHYPMYEWEGSFRNTIHFHGHSHGNIGTSFKDKVYDVGVDSLGYFPRTLEEIVGRING